jgi:hypothetical protein
MKDIEEEVGTDDDEPLVNWHRRLRMEREDRERTSRRMMVKLERFRRRYGHEGVPPGWSGDHELADWCTQQHQLRRDVEVADKTSEGASAGATAASSTARRLQGNISICSHRPFIPTKGTALTPSFRLGSCGTTTRGTGTIATRSCEN